MRNYFVKNNLIYFLSAILLIIYAAFYLAGLSAVPFHPDESTQIYMSSDMDTMLHHFGDLFWKPDNTADLKQHYHELDAPLTRYLIGIARLATATPPLLSDWDWSKTWQQNQASGALPDQDLLAIARFSVAFLTIISLVFLFDLLRVIFNPYTAFLAVWLYAINPLVLLHTRRAMAESVLLFSVIFFLWAAIRYPKKPLLVGLSLALAFCSKQSALLLFFPAVFAITIPFLRQKKYLFAAKQSAFLIVSFILLAFLLNPFAWTDPVHSIADALKQRQLLTNQQQETIFSGSPEKNISASPDKIAAAIGAVYYQPPAVADVANYLENTSSSQQSYFSNPLNQLLHDPIGSTILFILTCLGFVLSWIPLLRQPRVTDYLLILMLSFLSILLGLIIFISIPFQRYYLPLLPFLYIWISIALSAPFITPFTRRSAK